MTTHTDRIVILIDGNNILMGAHKMGFRVDYARLVDVLKSDDKLIRAYFFDGLDVNPDPKKEAFLDALRSHGITVMTRPLRYRSDGSRYQKGVDVALATELLALCLQGACDTAIIVSGDADYAHAIDRVKATGKKVYCASWKASLSKDLRQVADRIIILDHHKDKFTYG